MSKITPLATLLLVAAAGCSGPLGAGGAKRPAAATPMVSTGGPPEPDARDLAGEAWIGGKAIDIGVTGSAVRTRVRALGGRIEADELSGGSRGDELNMRLRVPPEQLTPLLDWLEGQLTVTSRSVQVADVTDDGADVTAALAARQVELGRLMELTQTRAGNLAEVLELEKEMTRLRGEIGELEAQQRAAASKVRLAVVHLSIGRAGYTNERTTPNMYVGPRAAMLWLPTADGRDETRLGVGAVAHLGVLHNTIEADFFERDEGSSASTGKRAALVTYGIEFYSIPAGNGKHRFLNPYAGTRIGWGYLDENSFVLALSLGVELVKTSSVLVDLNLRAVGFLHENPDAALVPGLNVSLGF